MHAWTLSWATDVLSIPLFSCMVCFFKRSLLKEPVHQGFHPGARKGHGLGLLSSLVERNRWSGHVQFNSLRGLENGVRVKAPVLFITLADKVKPETEADSLDSAWGKKPRPQTPQVGRNYDSLKVAKCLVI